MERDHGGNPEIFKCAPENFQYKKLNEYVYEVPNNTEAFCKATSYKNVFVVITGTSGSGKDSLTNWLPGNWFKRIKTCTTRQEVRLDETWDYPYVRLTQTEFEEQINQNAFVEFDNYAGNYYGTRKKELLETVALNYIPILRMNPQGGKNIMTLKSQGAPQLSDLFPIHFHITPPVSSELIDRLIIRDIKTKTDPNEILKAEKDLEKRIQKFETDLKLMSYAHYILINFEGELDQVGLNTLCILKKFLPSLSI